MINTPGHIIPLTSYASFGKRTRKCPREPLVFFSLVSPHTHTRTHFPLSLLPLPSSLTPIALARNTAPCFSWQNSAGCPCVPEKPANVHISHIFCLLSVSTSLQPPPHIIQAPRQCRTGWDKYVLSLTLHSHPPCLSSSVSKVSL